MRIISTKRRIECLHGLLFYRALHMQILLCHVQIRVADHALDRCQIHTERLHLTDICVPAEMRRQLSYTLNGADIGKDVNKLLKLHFSVAELYDMIVNTDNTTYGGETDGRSWGRQLLYPQAAAL